MEGTRLLRTIKPRNFLSYDSDGAEIPLEPLNVIIGPNASGKQDLIEALDVLKAAPRDVTDPIRHGGGVMDWLWNGEGLPVADVEVTVTCPAGIRPLHTFRHLKLRLYNTYTNPRDMTLGLRFCHANKSGPPMSRHLRMRQSS